MPPLALPELLHLRLQVRDHLPNRPLLHLAALLIVRVSLHFASVDLTTFAAALLKENEPPVNRLHSPLPRRDSPATCIPTPGFNAAFDASFAALEEGRRVLASAFPVSCQGITCIGNAPSSFHKGIAASWRAFAAVAEGCLEGPGVAKSRTSWARGT
jgi:hypothetical protein